MSSNKITYVKLHPIDGSMVAPQFPAMLIEDRRPQSEREKPSYIVKSRCPCCMVEFMFITEASRPVKSPDAAMCLGCLQAVATRAMKLNENYKDGDETWVAALQAEQAALGTLPKQKCGNRACKVSTGICGSLTFGSGELDPNGYWEYPCEVCAEAHLSRHPNDVVWPRVVKTADLLKEGKLGVPYIPLTPVGPHPYRPGCDCVRCDHVRGDAFPEPEDPECEDEP